MLFWGLVLALSLVFVAFIVLQIISDARSETGAQARLGDLGLMRISAIGLLAAAPIGAIALYMSIGAPQSLSPDFHEALAAQREDPSAALAALSPEERTAAIEAMVDGLAGRLAAEPDNPDGWRMLAQSYAVMGRVEESLDAYRQLVARADPPLADDWRNYVSALMAASPPDQPFGQELMTALNRLLGLNESDPLALFYLGLEAQEGSRPDDALFYWRRLLDAIPEDAPILPQLQALIAEAEDAAQSAE